MGRSRGGLTSKIHVVGIEIWSSGSSTRSSTVGMWKPATTSSLPTTSHSSNLRQSRLWLRVKELADKL